MIKLRQLDPISDVIALQSVLEAAPQYALNILGHPQEAGAAADVFAALPLEFPKTNKYVFGIHHGESLIGCIDLLRGFPTPNSAHIGLLLIKESAQGRGFGQAAFQKVEELIRTWSEISTLRLGVVETNRVVLGFWLKQGFNLTEKAVPYEHKTVHSRVLILEKTI